MKTKPFNPVDYFETDQEILEYLSDAYNDEDPAVFVVALGHVVKNKGVASVAERAGLGRESLYKALGSDSKPRWETVQKLLKALGIQIRFAA